MVLAISPTIEQSPQLQGFGLYEAANINNIFFGRWLKQQEESLSKKAFRELLKAYGMLRREATKFIKAATATELFEASDLARVGTMMFSLAEPKYQALWEVLQDYGELTQEIVSALKKEMFPSKKRNKNEPVSVWRQPPGGGTRYCQIPPIHDQETGVKLEKIVLEEGITPQHVVTEALECYEALKEGRLVWVEDVANAIAPELEAAGTVRAASEDLAGGTVRGACEDLAAELEAPELEATGTLIAAELEAVGGTNGAYAHSAQAKAVVETSPVGLEIEQLTSSQGMRCGVALHSSDVELSQSVVQSEAQSLAYAFDAASTALTVPMQETTLQVDVPRSASSARLQMDAEQPRAQKLQIPIPTPTDRWREGWKKGDVVVTNSTIPTLPRWVSGEVLQIVDVTGPVGSVQRVTVINSDFKQYSTYGNWVEVAPLCQVSGGDKEWSGKIVKIDSIGRTYHRVSAVDDESCWTSIKHEFLVPIDTTEATAVEDIEAAVNNSGDLESSDVEQIVFSEWGFGLGDVVQWAEGERQEMMAGRIYDVTADYALVDCGLAESVPIPYPQLKKITPDNVEKALTDHASPISQIFYKAKNYVAMWSVNALGARSNLKELLAMCWHYKVWIDIDAMESENVLMFVPGGKNYLGELQKPCVVEEDQEIPVNPVEEIAKVFRTAIKWSQVREALLTYGYEHKNAAWNLLFDSEKKWFLSLMPEPIQKLSRLKKQGLIVDFTEDASGENFFISLQRSPDEEQHVSLGQLDEFVRSLEQF